MIFPVVILSFIALCCGQSPSISLRVACRKGQPPFIDADVVDNNLVCSGLLYSMWTELCRRKGFTSQYYYFNGSANGLFDRMTVNTTTNRSVYDVGLSFSTISSDRMRTMDFTLPIVESQYVMGLSPQFNQQPAGFVSTLVRQSVLHLFAILSLFVLSNTLVLAVFETYARNGSFVKKPWSARVMAAVEGSLDITLYGATGIYALKSPVSKMVRIVTCLATLFMLALFGATITSQLTTSQINAKTPNLDSIRGKRILISSSTLRNFLQSDKVNAIVVETQALYADMKNFYSGNLPGIDGYALPEAITKYYHNLYSGDSAGYVLSDPFTEFGSKDLRAIIMSRSLPSTIREMINIAITEMRDEGYLGELYRLFVPTTSGSESSGDINIPPDEVAGVLISTVVGYSGLLAIVLGCLLYEKRMESLNRRSSSDSTRPQAVPSPAWGEGNLVRIKVGQQEFQCTASYADMIIKVMSSSCEGQCQPVRNPLRNTEFSTSDHSSVEKQLPEEDVV